jgi:hypothetical protein
MPKTFKFMTGGWKNQIVDQDKAADGVRAYAIQMDLNYLLATREDLEAEEGGLSEEDVAQLSQNLQFVVRSSELYPPYQKAILAITQKMLDKRTDKGGFKMRNDQQFTLQPDDVTLPIQVQAMVDHLIVSVINLEVDGTRITTGGRNLYDLLMKDKPLRQMILSFAADQTNFAPSKSSIMTA